MAGPFGQGANFPGLNPVPAHEQAHNRLRQELVQGHFAIHGALPQVGSRRIRIALSRGGEPYGSVEDLWRRAQVPAAALRRLAAADAFRGSLGLSRREALWAIRGLRDEPLPLFAAADARDGALRPELDEPVVALAPMTAGREVAEDYRGQGLSLRRHPLAFLRPNLARDGHVLCAELARLPNQRRIQVAGLVLIRQKPGSAKGVMFITLEDETGIANLIVWPKLFEAQRRLVLSAGMMSCRGQVQQQGGVTHVIVQRLTDLTPMLRRVGEIDDPFPLTTGRGDEARHGGSPDQRGRVEPRNPEADGLGRKPRDIYVPDLSMEALRAEQEESTAPPIRMRTRDFR